MGGYALGLSREPRETCRMIHAAIEEGITFMEVAWDYHQGESERMMGEALRGGYRDKVFLTGKIDGQTRRAAISQLDQSLKRLRVENLDLLLLNEIIRPEDPMRIFAPDGALEALVEAKRAGKIRFIGFSGHKDPAIHLKMLDMGFEFDAVQMPLNLLDAQFSSFEKQVLPLLVERGIGVLGMKPLAGGTLATGRAVTIADCLRYVLTLPTSTVVTEIASMADLALALKVLEDFVPLEPDEADFFMRKTADLAKEGRGETYKTTSAHDGTVQNPDWLTALS